MTQVGELFYITTKKGDQIRPAVSYFPTTNKYFVAWRSPTGGDRHGTFCRVVESQGQFSTFFSKLSTNDGGSDARFVGSVDIAVNGTDRTALVVWTQAEGGLHQGSVHGRFVNPDGSFEGDPFRISAPEASVYDDSSIQASWNKRNNQFLVVWEAPNTMMYKVPYGAVLDHEGKSPRFVSISGFDMNQSYDLQAVTSNDRDGEWLVVADSYFRVVDSSAALLTPPRTVPGIPPTIKLFDAFSSTSTYYLLGTERYQSRRVRLWAVTLSFDGTRIGTKSMIEAAAAFFDAKFAYNEALGRVLVLFSYRDSRRSELEAAARSLDMSLTVLDYKPYGVIDHHLYEETNGYPDCAVNTRDDQILVVWGYRRRSPAGWTTNHVMGKFVDIRDGLIVVKDEEGKLVEPASVWVNGTFRGNVIGGWLKTPIRVGDELIARAPIWEGKSHKKGHDPFGWGYDWAYQVYLTSAEVLDSGELRVHEVTEPLDNQVLVTEKRNTQIGFNLVASAEWDAWDHEIDRLEGFLVEASKRLFRATDGQFFIRHCKFLKNKGEWANADIRILSGAGQAVTLNHIAMSSSYMKMYQLGQSTIDAGTYTHELLHYICNVADEYEGWDKKPTVCTLKLNNTGSGPYDQGAARASCPSSGQGNRGPWKLCTTLPANPHNPRTKQGTETCWERLYQYYMHRGGWARAQDRWKLRRPTDRGVIMEGPRELPASRWMTCTRDLTTSSKTTGLTTAKKQPQTIAVGDGWSYLDSGKHFHTSRELKLRESDFTVLPSNPKIQEEKRRSVDLGRAETTAKEKRTPVLIQDPEGEPVPATLWLEVEERIERLGTTASDGKWSMASDVSPKTFHATRVDPFTGATLHGKFDGESVAESGVVRLETQPVALAVGVSPAESEGDVWLTVTTGRATEAKLHVRVYPHGAHEATDVSMSETDRPGAYRGVYREAAGLDDGGVIHAIAEDSDGIRSQTLLEFQLMTIHPDGGSRVPEGGGRAVFSLYPRTEPHQTVSLTEAVRLPGPLPADRKLVSGPFRLDAATPYLDGVLRVYPRGADEDTLAGGAILRWHEDTKHWESLTSFCRPEMGYIAGEVNILEDGSFIDPRAVYVAVAAEDETSTNVS